MRTIKFRYWNGYAKSMYPAEYFGISLNGDFLLRLPGENGEYMKGEKYEKNIIMQFTGLFDKNGKEIYEGDIVMIYRQSDYLEPEEYNDEDGTDKNHFNMENAFVCKQEVKWHGNGGYFCDEDTGEYCPSLGDSDDIVVIIIGNIYENPELITL